MFEAVAANDACVGCHEDVAKDWTGSLHQRADLEPAYLRSFALEPLAFCRSCHAPEAIATEEEPKAVAAIGVGCVTCHVTEGSTVLASQSGSTNVPAPHAIERSASFSSAQACAGCHEFRFPMARGHGRDALMQSTIAEHAESPASDRSCADCHMPKNEAGKRSHAFAASRDPDVLRRSVTIEARRGEGGAVIVTLTPVDPGHAFPTGDLFRRLEVWAEAAGPDDMSLAHASRYLARHWSHRRGQLSRVLLRDDRVMFQPVDIELDLGEAGRDHDIVWRVAYQRVAHPNGIDESDAEIEGEVVLGSGRLPR